MRPRVKLCIENNMNTAATHTSAGALLNRVDGEDYRDETGSVLRSESTVAQNCDMHMNGGEGSTTVPLVKSDKFTARRPVALALEPIDTTMAATVANAAAANSSTDGGFVRMRGLKQKYIDIGFNNITYTVNTGIWRRGKSALN